MKKFLFILLTIISLCELKATNYVVTTTANSGAGSLRYALQMCMTTAGPHTISFNIPTNDAGYNATKGVWVISPATVFPMVMQNNVTIDGTTQSANVGNTNANGPEIVIDGGYTLDYGLRVFNAARAVVKGLNIRGFTKVPLSRHRRASGGRCCSRMLEPSVASPISNPSSGKTAGLSSATMVST